MGFGEKSGVGVRQGGEFNVRRAGRGWRERAFVYGVNLNRVKGFFAVEDWWGEVTSYCSNTVKM